MNLKYVFPFLLLVINLTCTAHDRNVSEQEKSMIGQEIHNTLVSYYLDIKLHGLTAEFNYLDSSSDFYWVPPGASSAMGYDTIRTMIEQNADKFKSVINTWDSLHIIVLDKEHATYTGQLKSKMTDTSDQVFEMKLIESGVVVKRKSGWKLLGGQTAVIQ